MPVKVTHYGYVRLKVHGKFNIPVVPRIGVTQVVWSARWPVSHSLATLHLDRLLHFGKVPRCNNISFAVKLLQVVLLQIISLRYVGKFFFLHYTVRNRDTSEWQSSTLRGRNQVSLVKNEGAQVEAESLT